MDKDREEDRSKYILMGVEAYEAKEGASAELYRPLSKQEAAQKTWIKALRPGYWDWHRSASSLS